MREGAGGVVHSCGNDTTLRSHFGFGKTHSAVAVILDFFSAPVTGNCRLSLGTIQCESFKLSPQFFLPAPQVCSWATVMRPRAG